APAWRATRWRPLETSISDGRGQTTAGGKKQAGRAPTGDEKIFRPLLGVERHHHSPPPAAARVSPSSVTTARSSERSSAASTRRLTKSKAADWRSRGRGRSHAISSYARPVLRR